MKLRSAFIQFYPVTNRTLVPLLLTGILLTCVVSGTCTPLTARAETTRARAMATVRAILSRNAAACKINKVRSITAVRSRGGWRVTARLVMSMSGRPLDETAVWGVRASDGEAVAKDQLTAEISHGCP